MAMHLERIRVIEKSKRKQSKRKSLQQAKADHAKFLADMGLDNVSNRAAERRRCTASVSSDRHYRSGNNVPTSDRVHATAGRSENEYTGTLIKGIATMHKSNAVPVINKEQAIEISEMRRN
jgi:hypothetical protein